MALIDKYIPYNYRDTVSSEVDGAKKTDVEKIFESMFCDFPKPVRWLLDIRNRIMKPFGIKGGGSFKDLVIERNEEEIVLFKTDKHLDFWVGISCSIPKDGHQKASVTTIVRFNNTMGRVYFIGIWIFHKILVGSLLRRAVR